MICKYRMYAAAISQNDSDIEDFSGLFGLVILGSLGLYFADRALFYKAVAGLVVLIIVIVAGVILWGRRKARTFDATYRAITKDYGSVLNNFLDQFGRAKVKDAAFTYQQYAFTQEHLGYLQDDLKNRGVDLSTKISIAFAALH